KLQRSAHRSVKELATDILGWIQVWNDDPKPFVWTKTSEEILGSIGRYCGDILQATGTEQ
ncbi:MAG: IS630 family transposase, partial [Actinobacteria bacterium]|nr:IS630 family transposase [Actinomycetota bacterium]MBW3578650.1 IS630 family transposase [Actinomycetota bacterium]